MKALRTSSKQARVIAHRFLNCPRSTAPEALCSHLPASIDRRTSSRSPFQPYFFRSLIASRPSRLIPSFVKSHEASVTPISRCTSALPVLARRFRRDTVHSSNPMKARPCSSSSTPARLSPFLPVAVTCQPSNSTETSSFSVALLPASGPINHHKTPVVLFVYARPSSLSGPCGLRRFHKTLPVNRRNRESCP